MSYVLRKVSVAIPCFLLSIVLFVGDLAGQNGTISREEFNTIRDTYNAILKKEKYRIRHTHEVFPYVGAEPERIDKWITEFAPPDRIRSRFGLNQSDPEKKYERIVIGPRAFWNKGGEWKEIGPDSAGFGLSSGPNSVDYYFRGNAKVGKKDARLYEVISSSIFNQGQTRVTSYYKTKYWIGKDGRVLKTVGESDGLGSNRSRTTAEYEYDPNIKIEAPIK
jgi:hypothetical protein